MKKYYVKITISVTQGENAYTGNGEFDRIDKSIVVDSFEKCTKMIGQIVSHIPKEQS